MVKITLTERQITQLSRATSREVTLTLTEEQSAAVYKGFDSVKAGLIKATFTILGAGSEAAPFRPGGSVVSAEITGLDETKGALGTVGS